MKRFLSLLLALLFILLLAACGETKDATIMPWEDSTLYSDREINAALRAAKRVFARYFDGCVLTELAYSEKHSSDSEITILAAFDVDASGGAEGALNPNSHYTNYKFTFVRDLLGIWKLADNGYA